ncbi:hypothetical protein [Rickettsia australis]|uniref:hypothetical protein n=1 Tax=Rickettsia australis TaxID=787 RepID=UPI0002DEC17B|nr:hypothetical protein [Rickettsia australis]
MSGVIYQVVILLLILVIITYTTGELIINVLYDTINAGQTGNANSGNIVFASGSTFDLSNVSSIKVFLTAQNNPSAIGHGSAYPVISGAGGNISR